MKKGCLLLLLVLAGSFYGYFQLLKGTSLEQQYWIPALLAVGAAALVGNLHGIFLALAQKSGASKSRGEWRDGDLVGLSGMIQAQRSPITAPFSGASAAIVEYSIKEKVSGDDGAESQTEIYSGFLMAPCTVQSMRGSVKLVGFPLMTRIAQETFSEDDSYRRAAEYLSKAILVTKSSNPIAAIKQLNQVLTDSDGDVKADFCSAGAKAHEVSTDVQELRNDRDDSFAGEDLEKKKLPASSMDEIFYNLKYSGLVLYENAIKNGTEVTVFGTYRAQQQALDIGSGLTNLSHSIQLGSLTSVTTKNLGKVVLSSIIWAAIVAAGNWYVLKLIGINIPLDF